MDAKIDGLIWMMNKVNKDDKVSLDFKELNFIRPEAVILLIIASKSIFCKTHEVVDWYGLNSDSRAYLERIDITKVPFIHIQPFSPQFKWSRSTKKSLNLMELINITTPRQCADAMKQTKEILAKWFPEKISCGYCTQISKLIAEIANNSLEHSSLNHDGNCYYTLQKYQPLNKPLQVVIAFGDAGMGIRNNLKYANPWIEDRDALAIKRALVDGVSGRKDHSGGLGFKLVSDILRKQGGTIIVRSGYGSVTFTPKTGKINLKNHSSNFPGTQTAFIL